MRRKESIQIPVTLHFRDSEVKNVLCKIEIPQQYSDNITFTLYPNDEQTKKIELGTEMSFEGHIKSHDFMNKQVVAKQVIDKKGESIYITPDLIKTTYTGKIVSLTVFNAFKSGVNSFNKPEDVFTGHFIITDSNLLSPNKSLVNSYNGETILDVNKKKIIKMSNGIDLDFDLHYEFENIGKVRHSYPKLVATFNNNICMAEILELEKDLKSILALTSLAEGKRLFQAGKELFSDKYCIREFDNVMEDTLKGGNEVLIDYQFFDEFLNSAYTNLINSKYKNEIIQAIYGLTAPSSFIEYSFITSFSSLEAIITSYKRENGLEKIFDSEDEWKSAKKDIIKYLKSNNYFKDNKFKRASLYEKTDELKRTSFKKGLCHFIETYNLDLQGLWPLDSNGINSLTKIRNHLVHGGGYSEEKSQSVFIALIHLEWTLKRILLQLLGWDINKSSVSTTKINKRDSYINLTKYMDELSI